MKLFRVAWSILAVLCFAAQLKADPIVIGKPTDGSNASSGGRPESVLKLPEIDFVREAVDYGRIAKVGDKYSAVYATISILSPQVASEGDRTQMMYAHGRLFVVGSKATKDERLEGEIPVQFNSGKSGATPFESSSSTLTVSVTPNGWTTLGWKTEGKNFLGRHPTGFRANSNGSLLWYSGSFYGNNRVISISLTKGTWEKKTAVEATKSEKKQRGVKVVVNGFFKITNSEDGIADNTVELYGGVSLHNKNVFQAFNLDVNKGDSLELKSVHFDIWYDQPKSGLISVAGKLWDHDSASKKDDLWTTHQEIDLLKAMYNTDGKIVIPGDNKSESADLVILVGGVEKLY